MATRAQEAWRVFPGALGGARPCLRRDFELGIENCERMHISCFKSLSLWPRVTAALGHWRGPEGLRVQQPPTAQALRSHRAAPAHLPHLQRGGLGALLPLLQK